MDNVIDRTSINNFQREQHKMQSLLFILLIIIFCIPAEIRVGILGTKLGIINYCAILILLAILFKYINNFNKTYLIYLYIVLIYYIFSTFFYEKNAFNIIVSIGSYIIPLILIGLKLDDEKIFENIFKTLLNILNVLIVIITILGLVEYVFGIEIFLKFSKFMTNRTRELMITRSTRDIFRLYTFMGHPLFNTELYLIFYVLNNVYSRYFKKLLPDIVVILFSIVGIAMTASKTGLILILTAVILINNNKFKLRHILAGLTLGIMALYLGIFNNTIKRFSENGLTTGRSEMWARVNSFNLFPIKFFCGYGHGFTFVYNGFISWASAAFEYPIRMFSLEMGILMAILIYISIAVVPVAILIKRKHFFLLLSYLIVFVDVNTYNGLALAGDNMLILSIFIFILLNMSNITKRKVES